MRTSIAMLMTLVESTYLFYMFYFYKTRHVIGHAKYDQATQQLGRMFVHDTGQYENKVCLFGKLVAILAVACAFLRLWLVATQRAAEHPTTMQLVTLSCSFVCAVAAFHMNLTAFVYILPLLAAELLWVCLLR